MAQRSGVLATIFRILVAVPFVVFGGYLIVAALRGRRSLESRTTAASARPWCGSAARAVSPGVVSARREEAIPPLARLDRLVARHGGNLRELLFELYDETELQSATPPC